MPYPISIHPKPIYSSSVPPGGGIEDFDTPAGRELNRARIEHLRSLNLPVQRKRVLDVGCGVGHLAQFFTEQDCSVLCVDGRGENISRLRALYPYLEAKTFNIETDPISSLGRFDIVFAYGLLYHLENPFRALRNLAAICDELLLLETMILDHHLPLVRLAEESAAYTQALSNVGSRPTPSFVVLALRAAGLKHIYAPRNPPNHPDFQFEWKDDLSDSRNGHLLRCMFIASQFPLKNSSTVRLLKGR